MSDEHETPSQRTRRKIAERLARQPQAEGFDEPNEQLTVEEPEIAEPVDTSARRRELLQGIPDDIAAAITDDELEQIETKVRAKAAAERKKQALADIEHAMSMRARAAEGLIPAAMLRSEAEEARRQELVTFMVNLPEGGGLGLRVDGRMFYHGSTYTEPRHVADSLHEMIYRAHRAEIEFSDLRQNRVFRTGEPNGGLRASAVIYARNPAPFLVS